MSDPTIVSPPSLLKRAIAAVPAVKYALGVGGIIAVIAIVSSFNIGTTAAVFGTVVMLVLMTVLLVFANIAGQKSSSFSAAAHVLTWFSLVLFMLTASALFLAVFWGNVEEIRARLGIKPVSLTTNVPQTSAALVPTQQTTSKVSETEPSANPGSASRKKETPQETPKEVVPTPTAQDFKDEQNEARAHGYEVSGDDDAEHSISYMYCGLAGCNNKPPNQADVEQARKLWVSAVSKWTRALNATSDQAYYDRLREKIRPESGVSCDDHSCESNFTHENRSFGIHIPVNQFDPQ